MFETDSPLLWPQTVSPDGTTILFNTGQPYSTYKLSLPSDNSESSELNAELVALAPVTNLNLQAEISPDGNLPEIIEIPDHPWFIGVQFHPELKSKPFAPHPLFSDFIRAALKQSRLV